MVEKIWSFCKEKNLIEEKDYIVAGISGGADSVCLLYVLLELQKRIPFTIHVVHINHGIREEAHEDAEYVEKLCKENKLKFTLVECKVEEYAKENHLSCEEAGRLIRYKAFSDTLAANKGDKNGKIAIAHNENDLAETFLFNLFRGSGLKGLSGIQASREEIIRPLLCVSRREIENYLESRNIKYMTDKTNLEDAYTRNRIRHHILPMAEKEVTNAVGHIKEAAERIDEAYKLIAELTNIEYDRCVNKQDEVLTIDENGFKALPSAMQGYVVKKALEQCAGNMKDISGVHVQEICELFTKQTGRKIDLPYRVQATRVYQGVELAKYSEIKKNSWEYIVNEADFGQNITLPNGGAIRLEVREIKEEDRKNIPVNTYTKWFDYDKIKGSVCIRTRKTGDYFTLDEQGHKKSLKTFFVDEKIPAKERDDKYLIVEDNHVIWILGGRISFEYKIQADTKRILVVEFIKDSEKERK